jgi:hypothetical protein
VSRVTTLATNRVYIGFVVELGLSMLFPLQSDDAVEEGKER